MTQDPWQDQSTLCRHLFVFRGQESSRIESLPSVSLSLCVIHSTTIYDTSFYLIWLPQSLFPPLRKKNLPPVSSGTTFVLKPRLCVFFTPPIPDTYTLGPHSLKSVSFGITVVVLRPLTNPTTSLTLFRSLRPQDTHSSHPPLGVHVYSDPGSFGEQETLSHPIFFSKGLTYCFSRLFFN